MEGLLVSKDSSHIRRGDTKNFFYWFVSQAKRKLKTQLFDFHFKSDSKIMEGLRIR